MIKIYLFVTGLVLFVAPSEVPNRNATVYAVLASGDRQIAGIDRIREHTGTFEISPGLQESIPSQAHLVIERACGVTGCSATTLMDSQHVPRLSELGLPENPPSPKAACLDPKQLDACVDANGVQAASALVEIRGPWAAKPLTECPGEFASELKETVLIGFVDARNATRSLLPITQPKVFANTLRFETEVESLDQVTISLNGESRELTLAPLELCQDQPGFPKHDDTARCAILAVRHGDANVIPSRFHPANLHFAALYDLVDSPPETLWLPYRIDGEVCQGGGGSSGLHLCIGSLVGDWGSP